MREARKTFHEFRSVKFKRGVPKEQVENTHRGYCVAKFTVSTSTLRVCAARNSATSRRADEE